MQFTILIEQDEDGIYIAKVPDISGCYKQGKTIPQVMERIKDAMRVCLESEKVNPLKFVGVQQIQINNTA